MAMNIQNIADVPIHRSANCALYADERGDGVWAHSEEKGGRVSLRRIVALEEFLSVAAICFCEHLQA